MPTALPPGDLEVLEFERTEPALRPGPKVAAIRQRFGLSEPRYAQRLNRILHDPAAVAYDPLHVNRLLRLAARRKAARSNR